MAVRIRNIRRLMFLTSDKRHHLGDKAYLGVNHPILGYTSAGTIGLDEARV